MERENRKMAVFCLILMIPIFLLFRRVAESRMFTPERWRATDPEKRMKLFEDFEDRYKLVGMSKAQVLRYLGESEVPPDEYYDWKRSRTPRTTGPQWGRSWAYRVKRSGWLFQSTVDLIIHFDRSEKVSSYEKYSYYED